MNAAWSAGCRRFDTVLGGIGGCPMADDELVGNLDTLKLLEYCQKNKIKTNLKLPALQKASELISTIIN